MRVLIIGGTRFQGIYLIEGLLKLNASITVFHRGINPLQLKGEVKEILGDRNTDLSRIPCEFYDWVIDTCAYRPEHVESVLHYFNGHFVSYCLISSVYTYAQTCPKISEDSDLVSLKNPDEELNAENYGAFKVECEKVVKNLLPKKNYLILRPCVLIGPGDHSGRMDFWLELYSTLKNALSFSDDNRSIQLIDVRDYICFVVHCLKNNIHGVINVTSESITFQNFLNILNSIHHLSDCKLMEWSKIEQRSLVPYALPTESEDYLNSKAISLGLRLRPVEDTIKDCYKIFKESKPIKSYKNKVLFKLFL